MDSTKQSLPILSLCTGMRGIERGLERAFVRLGWPAPKTIVNVEIEAFAAWNLVKQMEQGVLDPAPVWSNLKTFNWSTLRGKVFCITGGYPCQPFSLAGKLKGTEDPRHLWPYIKTGIATIRPVCCFFENVRNHLNIGYDQVKADLEELGYEVEQGIYSAEEVGAPHKRDRLFILAICKSMADTMCINGGLSVQPGGSQQKGNETERGSEGVGNTSCANEQRTGLCEERVESQIGGSGTNVDNSICTGLEGQSRHESASGWKGTIGSATPAGFPLGQGHAQWEWEEPRLESRVGNTINGYDFTEDLLRLAGNGVVEQTAELAFLHLLEKLKNK